MYEYYLQQRQIKKKLKPSEEPHNINYYKPKTTHVNYTYMQDTNNDSCIPSHT